MCDEFFVTDVTECSCKFMIQLTGGYEVRILELGHFLNITNDKKQPT